MTFPVRMRSCVFGSLLTIGVAALTLGCLTMSSAISHAQLITGSISGRVSDPSGAMVAKANIILLNQNTRDSRKAVSNDSGYFTFAGVNPGTYTVSVEAQGFKTVRRTDIALMASDSVLLPDLQLSLGATSESVVISAGEAPMINTENGERSSTISQDEMQRMPVESRNVSEMMKNLPGVTMLPFGDTNSAHSSSFDMNNDSSGSSALGVLLSPNGAPFRGGTAYLLDGADIIDRGVNAWAIVSVKPEFTQEVKIQTSNFGADSADGPVIMASTSKAGTADYHGEAYFFARNAVLNSNEWLNKHNGQARSNDHYYYPGGNIGGPVRLPWIAPEFNKNHKLLFWFGYEGARQNLGAGATLKSTIPTSDMLAGNFTSTTANNGVCTSGFTSTGTDWCADPTGGYAPDGTKLTSGNISAYINSSALALTKLWPTANISNPNGSYNYYKTFSSEHDVNTLRFRIDYSLNDNNKIFAAYQHGSDNVIKPGHIWWDPALEVPYPGGVINNPTTSQVWTFNMVSVITPSLTNEFVFAWAKETSPYTVGNLKDAYSSTIGYGFGTIYNSSLLAPSVNGTWGLPDTSMPDIWTAGGGKYPLSKATASFSDNITKVWKEHTFKAGAFNEQVLDNEGNWATLNGTFSFDHKIQNDPVTGRMIGTANPTANFLMGISSGFTQQNSEPLTNMSYRITSGYAQDDWKVTRRLTANVGIRFDHIGRWNDRNGNGLAVWMPQLYAFDVANNSSWAYPGVRWHGIDPGIPNSGSPNVGVYVSPRFGLAWDVYGTGKTVIHGGWGEYRWNDSHNDYAGPVTTANEEKTYNTSSNSNYTFADISSLGSSTSSLGSLGGLSGVADPNDRRISTTRAYNLTFSQKVPWNTVVEVAYVGNTTINMLMGGATNASSVASGFTNQNKVPLGGLFKADPVTGAAAPSDPENVSNLADYYPYYVGYGTNNINMSTHVGYANYNGLQVVWAKQHGDLTFNFNYTFSKALGILANTLDAFTVHGNYGILNIDRPHVFNSTYAYTFSKPYRGENKILAQATNGWTISGTTTLQSGGNLQAIYSQNLGMSIKNTTTKETLSSSTWYGTPSQQIQPTQLCNPRSGLQSQQLIKASCFGVPAVGKLGLRQFPYLYGPDYVNTDLTIYKNFAIRGKQSVEFRAALFDAFNHPLWDYNGVSAAHTLTFTTSDNASFTNTSTANLAATEPVWGKMYYKSGQRFGELSVKYIF